MQTERRPWSKWRWFAVYWAVQAPAAYVGWAAMIGDGPTWRRVLSPLADPGYLVGFSAVVAPLMFCQAAFLLPVREPSAGPERCFSRAGRCVIAGGAIGVLVATALCGVFLGLTSAGIMSAPHGQGDDPVMFWVYAAAAGALATLALLYSSARARSAHLSVVIAALAAAGLSMGIPWVAYSAGTRVLALDLSEEGFLTATAATLLVNWAVATPLLARFVRKRGVDDGLGRVAAWLFTGSVIEAAAVIPLDVMVRRKTDCYCGEGTLWTLTICWGIGGLALGPAVWLIPLAKRRKRWYGGRCAACGYDMRGSMTTERCPECGIGWKPALPGEGATAG
jgi:hypothetical protein